jgi:hypothetical protein
MRSSRCNARRRTGRVAARFAERRHERADAGRDHDEDHVIGDAAVEYAIEVSDDQIVAVMPA